MLYLGFALDQRCIVTQYKDSIPKIIISIKVI